MQPFLGATTGSSSSSSSGGGSNSSSSSSGGGRNSSSSYRQYTSSRGRLPRGRVQQYCISNSINCILSQLAHTALVRMGIRYLASCSHF